MRKAGPLFASETAKPLTASHVGQTLLKRRERLPIPKFTTHDLRRTFSTALDSMGIGIELIAAIVGHDSAVNRQAKTLVRHYLRTDKLEQKRAALEAWDRRLRAILADEEESVDRVNLLRMIKIA
jgi:integrase